MSVQFSLLGDQKQAVFHQGGMGLQLLKMQRKSHGSRKVVSEIPNPGQILLR